MRKSFIDQELKVGRQFTWEGPDVFHLLGPLRMKEGSEFILVDKLNLAYRVKLVKLLGKDKVSLYPLDLVENSGEGPFHIKLYQALPKADKFDLIVRQAVELGVNEIVPVNLDHCVTKLSGSRLAKKLDRWQRLALAASKQAGRACIPQIGPLKSLSEVVREMEAADLAFVAYENEVDYTLKDFCRAYWPQVKQGVCLESRKAQVAFLVGPEGGISRLEIDQLTEAEIPCVGLGPRILRTETCSAAILSMLLYEVEL